MNRAAVIGAGTMGNGIAHVFAQHGWDVALIDSAPAALEQADRDHPRQSGAAGQEGHDRRRGAGADPGPDQDRAPSSMPRRTPTSWSRRPARTPRSSSRLFEQLDRIAAPRPILATNTSSISITEIAARTGRPDQVIGMHFMNPVPVMQLVEVIRGQATSDATTRDGDGHRPGAGQDAGRGERLSRASSPTGC